MELKRHVFLKVFVLLLLLSSSSSCLALRHSLKSTLIIKSKKIAFAVLKSRILGTTGHGVAPALDALRSLKRRLVLLLSLVLCASSIRCVTGWFGDK